MLSRMIHNGGELFYTPSHNKFLKNLDNIEQSQKEILTRLLEQSSKTFYGKEKGIDSSWSYEDFKQNIPLSSYEDFEELILKQIETGQNLISENCKRYQPTSGTTSKRKWIPYTESFLSEMKRGTAPWYVDIYRKYPKARSGKHFWSLSWIPTELRNSDKDQDDLTLFPWWQRFFMQYNMVVPSSASYAKTSEATMLATLAYLCAKRDLSVIFIWSPTLFDQILDQIWVRRDELSYILTHKNWGDYQNDLKGVPAPKSNIAAKMLSLWNGGDEFFKHLWPNLTLLSCWDSASSKIWAKELRERLPHVSFQGKGLFATEGIVTIPYHDSFLLTYRSHFYEFECLETKNIIPSWELEKDQRVKPLLSTGSGLFRYSLNDELKVVGFEKKCPKLEFQGRISGVDLVGEKMEAGIASKLLRELESLQAETPLKGICLLAVKKPKGQAPYYLALFQGPKPGEQFRQYLEKKGESILLAHFHYQLARELRQLGSFKVLISEKAMDEYIQVAEIKGTSLGDIKVDPLLEIESM